MTHRGNAPKRLRAWQLTVTLGITVLSISSADGQFRFLDGKSKKILVFHDSVDPSSFLRKRLEKFFNNNSPIEVVGGPQGRYLAVVANGSTLTATGWLSSFSPSNAGGGTVIPLVLTNFREDDFVAGPSDKQNIDRIASELKFALDELKRKGAAKVIYSSYHFNYSHRRLAENEPLVIDALRKSTSDHVIVDMVTPTLETIDSVPMVSGDTRHGTAYAWEKYGHEWFKAMCEHDGIQVPAWSQAMVDSARSTGLSFMPMLRLVSPKTGRFRAGDPVTVKWSVPACPFTANRNRAKGTVDKITIGVGWRRLDVQRDNSLPYNKAWYGFVPDNPLVCGHASGGIAALCCADIAKGEYTFTLPDYLFDPGGNNGKEITGVALPFYIQLSSDDGWKEVYSRSAVDWQSPSNMLLAYKGTIDPKVPVYPSTTPSSALRGPRETKTSLILRKQTHGSFVEFLDLRGRSVAAVGVPVRIGGKIMQSNGAYLVRAREPGAIPAGRTPVLIVQMD